MASIWMSSGLAEILYVQQMAAAGVKNSPCILHQLLGGRGQRSEVGSRSSGHRLGRVSQISLSASADRIVRLAVVMQSWTKIKNGCATKCFEPKPGNMGQEQRSSIGDVVWCGGGKEGDS